MNQNFQLNDLKPGQTASVSSLSVEGTMRRRLQDMGLIEGTRVECIGISPLGDPAAYLIRGAVIALRKKDAGEIGIDTTTISPSQETSPYFSRRFQGSRSAAQPVPLGTARD